MELIVEVKNEKVKFFLELIQSLPFVTIKEKTYSEKRGQIASLKQAVKEMKQVKAGKLKAKPLKDVLNEL